VFFRKRLAPVAIAACAVASAAGIAVQQGAASASQLSVASPVRITLVKARNYCLTAKDGKNVNGQVLTLYGCGKSSYSITKWALVGPLPLDGAFSRCMDVTCYLLRDTSNTKEALAATRVGGAVVLRTVGTTLGSWTEYELWYFRGENIVNSFFKGSLVATKDAAGTEVWLEPGAAATGHWHQWHW
jgi:hypothetical protein